MSYYIKLDGDKQIELPNDKTLEERIQLCTQITNEYPEYFEQKLPTSVQNSSNACEKVQIRLSIMADYLLACSPQNKVYPTLTNYKNVKHRNHEITFSEFEMRYDNDE